MKRLWTLLMAAAFAASCAVGTTTQEEVEADVTTYEFDVPTPVTSPEGPGSCVGWASAHHPGYVVVPAECLAGTKYYYMGDPWVQPAWDFEPDNQAE